MATNPTSPRRPTPSLPPRNTAAAFVPGGLKDTLAKLSTAIEALAGGATSASSTLGAAGGLGGLGTVGMGIHSAGLGATARLAMAPVQALATQIQRTTHDTARSFATALAQVDKTWKRSTTGFATDFFAALNGQAQRRRSRGAHVGRATRRTWRSALDWSRRQAQNARLGAARWVKRSQRWIAGPGWRSVTRATRRARANLARWSRQGRRTAAGWARQVSRARRSFGRWGQQVGRRWNRATTAWTKSAQRSYRRATRWASRTRMQLGRNVSRWGRRVGRRARVGWGRAGRAFARTGSVGAAFRSGAGGFLGRGTMRSLNEFSGAVSAITGTLKAMQQNFETVNAGNRHLAGYSGPIAAAFGQLALGDQQRNVKLARSSAGSAVTLTNLVNQSREIQGSFDRLTAGVSNRAASAQAVLWNQVNKPWALAADSLTGMINQFDPKGDAPARLAASPFSFSAGVGGFLGALWGGASTKEALEEAKQVFEKQQKDALKGEAPKLDAVATWINNVQNMGPIRPVRFVAP